MKFHKEISKRPELRSIEVSVEDGSLLKHCRKKWSPITFTANAQVKKAEEPWSKYDI